MLLNILLYIVLFILFFVLYYIVSHVNLANLCDMRKVGLVKYKIGKKIKYKTIVADKYILKDFLYTKSVDHLRLKKHRIPNLLSIYCFDRDLNVFEFNGKVCRPLSESECNTIVDTYGISFLNIYHYLAVNRFMGRILTKLDDIKRKKVEEELKEQGD